MISCCLCSQCCCRGSKDGDTGYYCCERNCAGGIKFAIKAKTPSTTAELSGLNLSVTILLHFLSLSHVFAYIQDNCNFDDGDMCLIRDLFKI